MRVNVLIVAAMVITSVNANWLDRLLGRFWSRCTSCISQEFDPPEEDPVCDSIVIELEVLWGRTYVLDLTIQTQMPILSNIIKEEGGSSASKIKKVEDWFKSHSEDKDTIGEMRNEHTDLMEQYYKVWKRFSGSGCLVEKFMELSPDNNDKKGLLFLVHEETTQAQDTNESGVNISDKQ
ncbi:hypothetical protein BASA61_004446 [Batrachochytrium salamandrivorans]|nr:hypothetical protein BASA60_008706 [Batrachochytrium salamandrivorans]KAH6592736.1 hypothetical protein BASA61_004446 [Batrachochytrium salamandrivorans]KAH9272560.1 hypothetical protein BASA83_005060 [Batrachochytrium salamandrivorans]